MFGHCKDTSGLISDRVQLKIKCIFLYLLILWRPLVSIVCIRTYIIMYTQGSHHKKSLGYQRGSTTENQWLATNFSGNHLSLTCGHSHLCAYKVSVSAACGSFVWMYLNTSTSNVRLLGVCLVRICILFAFRRKPGLRSTRLYGWTIFQNRLL